MPWKCGVKVNKEHLTAAAVEAAMASVRDLTARYYRLGPIAFKATPERMESLRRLLLAAAFALGFLTGFILGGG